MTTKKFFKAQMSEENEAADPYRAVIKERALLAE